MEKLQINHLAPYLPYGLKCQIDLGQNEIVVTDSWGLKTGSDYPASYYDEGKRYGLMMSQIKPLLRPLSDLYKEMEDGIVPIVEIAREMGLKFVRYDFGRNCVDLYLTDRKGKKARFWYDSFKTGTFRLIIHGSNSVNQLVGFTYLFQHHYDVWDLIGQNLAIDKSKIK